MTTLVSFNSSDGANPFALTLGNDGNFYGTTSGGSSDLGTLFQVTTNGTLTPLVAFNVNDGESPNAALTLGADGNFYGTTCDSSGLGAVFRFLFPPLITAQPTNLLVLAGTNAAFGVSLNGTAPFGYQWRFNGTNLLNATNAIYSIPSVGTNNAGNYAVVITNAAGSATSSNAALTVVLSPKSRTNYASSTATFTATAFSPESLNYQWQKNGTNLVDGGNLSGATNSTLTIASVSDADAANYSAVVSDASGSVTTSNAVLTVNDLLFIASQPQSQTVGLGSNVTFNVTVYGAPPFVFQWYFNGTPLGSPSHGHKFFVLHADQCGNQSGGQLQCAGRQWLWQCDEFQCGADGEGISAEHKASTVQSESDDWQQRLIQRIRQRHGSI